MPNAPEVGDLEGLAAEAYGEFSDLGDYIWKAPKPLANKALGPAFDAPKGAAVIASRRRRDLRCG